MSADGKLHQLGAYRKACGLFDLAAGDMTPLPHNPLCARLVSQQMASADSIDSNIEEGYGRASPADYARFLVIARGSASETRGRYEKRLKHWLPQSLVLDRVALCEEIIAILSASIRRLRID